MNTYNHAPAPSSLTLQRKRPHNTMTHVKPQEVPQHSAHTAKPLARNTGNTDAPQCNPRDFIPEGGTAHPYGGDITDCLSAGDLDGLILPLLGTEYLGASLFYSFRTGNLSADALATCINNTLTTYGRVFLPIHIRHHWMSAIMRRTPDLRLTVQVVDSAPSPFTAREVRSLLATVLGTTTPIIFTSFGRQIRGSNECGLFVLRIAEALAEHDAAWTPPHDTSHVSLGHRRCELAQRLAKHQVTKHRINTRSRWRHNPYNATHTSPHKPGENKEKEKYGGGSGTNSPTSTPPSHPSTTTPSSHPLPNIHAPTMPYLNTPGSAIPRRKSYGAIRALLRECSLGDIIEVAWSGPHEEGTWVGTIARKRTPGLECLVQFTYLLCSSCASWHELPESMTLEVPRRPTDYYQIRLLQRTPHTELDCLDDRDEIDPPNLDSDNEDQLATQVDDSVRLSYSDISNDTDDVTPIDARQLHHDLDIEQQSTDQLGTEERALLPVSILGPQIPAKEALKLFI